MLVPYTIDRASRLTVLVDDRPEGYNRIATFQSSDANFLLYRGFGYLHCRLLSSLQYEVESLETELDQLDDWEMKKGDRDRLTCKETDNLYASNEKFPKGFQLKFKRTRPEVLEELRQKLMHYGPFFPQHALRLYRLTWFLIDEALLKTREVSSLQRPSRKDYKSVKSWFMNHEPVVQGEWKHLLRKEDVITLRTGRECAGFDGFVEYVLQYLDACLTRYRCHIIRVSTTLREMLLVTNQQARISS